MKLRDFQQDALDSILSCFKSGEKTALVEMPAGTGKTVLSQVLIQSMVEDHNVDAIAYVASTTVMRSHVEEFIQKKSQNVNRNILVIDYSDLLDRISTKGIEPDAFDVLIFDDLSDLYIRSSSELFEFFTGFKVAFTRGEIPHQSNRQGKNVVYRYTLQQAVNDGILIESQRSLFRHSLNNFLGEINSIEMGADWTEAIKQPLVRSINLLRNENAEYMDAIDLLLSGQIESAEILEISHKKKQLEVFERMLNDDSFFDAKANESSGEESAWQMYFESNPWIFGFGLNYIFNTPLDGKRLEQTVDGFSIKGHGKRTDALLKTTGLIQTLCFGEIKTHRKRILKSTKLPYRSDSWAVSDEVSGGISQIHRTVQRSIYNLNNELALFDEEGYRLKHSIYLYKPKAFLIIGSLDEFRNSEGDVNESKFSSFELFRKSLSDIEIITFDELFERANAIVNKKWGCAKGGS